MPLRLHVHARDNNRVLSVFGALVYIKMSDCTTLFETTGLIKGPTLLYGGMLPTYFTFNLGVAFWAIAALLFIRPFWVARNILLIGGFSKWLFNPFPAGDPADLRTVHVENKRSSRVRGCDQGRANKRGPRVRACDQGRACV